VLGHDSDEAIYTYSGIGRRGFSGLGDQVTHKLLAHTVGVWRNLQHRRESLQFDGLMIT